MLFSLVEIAHLFCPSVYKCIRNNKCIRNIFQKRRRLEVKIKIMQRGPFYFLYGVWQAHRQFRQPINKNAVALLVFLFVTKSNHLSRKRLPIYNLLIRQNSVDP